MRRATVIVASDSSDVLAQAAATAGAELDVITAAALTDGADVHDSLQHLVQPAVTLVRRWQRCQVARQRVVLGPAVVVSP